MSLCDRDDGFHARRVIKQRATTAIDLHVNKSRCEDVPVQIDAIIARRYGQVGPNCFNDAAAHQHGLTINERIAESQATILEDERSHCVSVTLLSQGGASGFRPRARAKASAQA